MVELVSIVNTMKAAAETAKPVIEAVDYAQRLNRLNNAVENLEHEDATDIMLHAVTEVLPAKAEIDTPTTEYASAFPIESLCKAAADCLESAEALAERLDVDVVVDAIDKVEVIAEKLKDLKPIRLLAPSIDALLVIEKNLYPILDNKFGLVVTAKKVDYLTGSEYQGGFLESVPMIGKLARVNHKYQLNEVITRRDLISLGRDAAFIIELVAATTGFAPAVTGARWAQKTLNSYDLIEEFLNTDIQPVARVTQPPLSAIERARVEDWIAGKDVTIEGTITPGDFSERFKAIVPYLDAYFQHCCETQPDIADLLEGRRAALEEARKLGPGAVQSVMSQAKRNLTGRFAEQFVTDALKPYFNGVVGKEVGVAVGDRTTRIDRVFSDAKAPIIGRGGLHVPKGGSLAVEVKSGQAAYIHSQAEHLAFQTTGASAYADASIVITTQDIRTLASEVEKQLRDGLRDNALIYKLMPAKDILDKTVLEALDKTWYATASARKRKA